MMVTNVQDKDAMQHTMYDTMTTQSISGAVA